MDDDPILLNVIAVLMKRIEEPDHCDYGQSLRIWTGKAAGFFSPSPNPARPTSATANQSHAHKTRLSRT